MRAIFRFLAPLLLFAALAPPVFGQGKAGPFTINASTSPCATIGVTQQSTVGITVTGTFSATLQPEVAMTGRDGSTAGTPQNTQVTPSSSSTAQSTITAAGAYKAAVGGFDTFLVCVTSYASGSATIYLNASPAVSTSALASSIGGTINSGNTGNPAVYSGSTAISPLTGPLIIGSPPSSVTTGNGKCAGQGLGAPILDVYDITQSSTRLIETMCKSNTSSGLFIGFTDYMGAAGFTFGDVSNAQTGLFVHSDGEAYPATQFVVAPEDTSGSPHGGFFVAVQPVAGEPSLFFENAAGNGDAKLAWGTDNCGAAVQNTVGMCIQSNNGSSFQNANVYAAAFHAGAANLGAAPADGTFEGVTLNLTGKSTAATYATTTNCAASGTAANPSVVSCSAAAAGLIYCDVAASAGTCVVNTTAVTANSVVLITPNSADGTTLSKTCNTGSTVTVVPVTILAVKSAGAGFTINMPTETVNGSCFEYMIVN